MDIEVASNLEGISSPTASMKFAKVYAGRWNVSANLFGAAEESKLPRSSTHLHKRLPSIRYRITYVTQLETR